MQMREAASRDAEQKKESKAGKDEDEKIYRFIIPNKYMGLTIPASQLTREILRYIYELSGGYLTIEEIIVKKKPSRTPNEREHSESTGKNSKEK
jgi:hypothetical protein